jgi:hypothetical protein
MTESNGQSEGQEQNAQSASSGEGSEQQALSGYIVVAGRGGQTCHRRNEDGTAGEQVDWSYCQDS